MQHNQIVVSIIPALIFLFPLVGAVGAMFADRYRSEWRNGAIIGSVTLPLLFAALLYPGVSSGKIVYLLINLLPPAGIEFRIDLLSMYMLLLFSFLSVIIIIYTIGYYKNKQEGKVFFYFMLIAISGCLGVSMSGNMLTFFLFFELMSLSFVPLVAYKSNPGAYRAGLKFFFMTIISGVALFWAVVITYTTTGSLAFGLGGLVTEGEPVLAVAFVCYLIAFGIKSAVIPLHIWMPDAYAAAPTPAATISSVIMLKTGVLGLIRVFHDIFGLTVIQETGWNNILLVLAIISMLYGSICAFAQDDLNRRLAYSGIAQVGYILLGLALVTEMALVGTVYHIMAHAFMKGCMFLCAGVIYVNTGKTKISEMKGIGMQMPVTMLAFTIAAVSSVGIPPFNLFVSKWHLGLGAIEAGMPAIILVLLLSSILNASYYFPISINAFLGCRELQNIERQRLRLQPLRMVPLLIFAAGAFIFTIMPYNWPLSLARAIAQLYF